MEHIFAPGLFKGRVALVTGGGTGIGFATVELFCRLGGSVAICSRKADHIEPAAEKLRAVCAEVGGGGQVHAGTCDIRELEQVSAFVDSTVQALGRIDVLVNNAGGQFPTPAEMLAPKGWDAVIRNNLSGTWYMTQAVAQKAFLSRRADGTKGGRIISIIAEIDRGFPGMVHTGAARAGVENFTKTLAVEWAQHNVQVTCIAPGIIASAPYPPELMERGRMKTPAKRLGTVLEVAQCVLYLASPAAAFITGTTIHLDGGARLWGESWLIPDHQKR
jgi:citronellol/citronellal dehydrogenase